MNSRLLYEMTTPQVEAYFRRCADADADGPRAILPVGCVEMHGPHQPIGTDTLVSKALALMLAERADALVLPEIHYTWAGSTDGFVGTISIEPEMTRTLVERVVERAVAGGFAQVVILSIHAPNRMVLGLAARRLFEKLKRPVAYVDGYDPVDETGKELFAGDYAAAKEASLVLAAMQVLGRGEVLDEAAMAVDDKAPPHPESFFALRPALVGYYMQDPRQHACPSSLISSQRGMQFLERQVDAYAEVFDKLARYARDVREQSNHGY